MLLAKLGGVKLLSFISGLTRTSFLFLLMVAIPTTISGIYYVFIASDRYYVQTDFIVRSIQGTSQSGGLSSLFQTFGITRAEDQSYAVIDFILSRDAVKAIDKEHSLRQIFSKDKADYFAKYPYWWEFWRGEDFETLYDYYLWKVEAWYQSSKGGIITMTVIAFSPEEAKTLSELLLHQAELLINRMNERANTDAISFAQKELDRAEKMVLDAHQRITEFRNRELILDPVADSIKVLDLIGALTLELAVAQRQLNETLQGSPSNPSIQSLNVRIKALNDQIAVEKLKIAGQDTSLAGKIAIYERLLLESQFADGNLGAAFATLQAAQQNAWHQQLYIETIAKPNLPDEFTEPESTRWVSAVFVITFILFSLLWLAISATKEHAN